LTLVRRLAMAAQPRALFDLDLFHDARTTPVPFVPPSTGSPVRFDPDALPAVLAVNVLAMDARVSMDGQEQAETEDLQ
jgi:hypothetical protein